jgi:hypothetical protein
VLVVAFGWSEGLVVAEPLEIVTELVLLAIPVAGFLGGELLAVHLLSIIRFQKLVPYTCFRARKLWSQFRRNKPHQYE